MMAIDSEVSLGAIIAAVLALDPPAQAVEYEGRWASWGDLAWSVADMQAHFADQAIRPGTRIGVMLRNRPAQLAAILAVLADDHCLVTVNPSYPDATLADEIRALGLPILLGEASDLDREGVMAAAEAAGTGVLVLGPVPGVGSTLRTRVMRKDEADCGNAIEMLSSGTTGQPKRVPLARDKFRHALTPAIAQEACRHGQFVARLRPGCRILTAPLAHIGGIWGMLRGIIAGRRIALLDKFRLDAWLDLVRRHRPASVALPPAALKMILDANVPAEDLASLKTVTAGTAPTDPAVIDAFWMRYGLPVLVNYGATEFGGPVANWSVADFYACREAKRGSVGRLYPAVEARTACPRSGIPLSPGKEGLLELRGPQFPDPQAWLRTNDLALVDDDRFLWITGRHDAAILRGGFKVHGEDVVRALESHPAVREAAVTGILDSRLGQVPAAAVTIRDGATFDERAIYAHLREMLLPYQIPVIIACLDEFPRTTAMKPALGELAGILKKLKDKSA